MSVAKVVVLLFSLLNIAFSKTTVVKYRIREDIEFNGVIGNIFDDSRLVLSTTTKTVRHKVYSTELDPELVRLDYQGQILANKSFDREVLCPNVDKIDGCQLEFMFHIFQDHWIKVFIIVLDINDNRPKFLKREKNIEISETIVPGYQIPLETAVDEDLEYYGVQSYSLDTNGPYFSIHHQSLFSLTLVVLKKVDYEDEQHRSFNLTLMACDGGTPVQCDRQKLLITVSDVNDNQPMFDQAQYQIFVKESIVIGTTVFIFNATDLDSGLFGKVSYKILPSRTKKNFHAFELITDTGELLLKNKLDAKTSLKFILTVEARDENGKGMFSTQCQLTIRVQDENDHAPTLSLGDAEKLSVKENTDQGDHVGMVIASDRDLDDSGKVDCSIDGNFNNYLALVRSHNMKDEIIYRLLTKTMFDKEKLDFFVILIVCQDAGKPSLTSSFYFNVTVVDINEYPPFFESSNYSTRIPEDIPVNSQIIHLRSYDNDKTFNHSYSLEPHPTHPFEIDSSKGVVRNIKSLDREQMPNYVLLIYVKDNINGIERTGSTTLYLTLSDVNDHVPVIIGSKQFSIRENEQVLENGNLIAQLQTHDLDNGTNASVICELLSVHVLVHMSWQRTFNHTFTVKENTCHIYVRSMLDREQYDEYKLNVMVSDLGEPRKTGVEVVTVLIEDQNDNYPTWKFPDNLSQYETNISNYISNNNHIFTILANDGDSPQNANISYFFINSDIHENWYQKYFFIEKFTGGIFLKNNLQETGTYYLHIQATDNGYPPLFSDVTVLKVTILSSSRHNTLATTSQMNFTLILVTSLAAFSICIAFMIGIVLMWRRSSTTASDDQTIIQGNWDDPKMVKLNDGIYIDASQCLNSTMNTQQQIYSTVAPDICNICIADPLLPLYNINYTMRHEYPHENQV